MDDDRTTAGKAISRHLVTSEKLATAAGLSRVDITRSHGQGNGLRVHGIYIAVVSVVVLIAAIAAIAIASSMM